MLPLQPIKKIFIQKRTAHHVSVEALIQMRDFLEHITAIIAQEAFNELDRYNHHRKQQGIKEKKRLPAWIIKKITGNILKQFSDSSMGSQSKQRGIGSPGGEEMSTQANRQNPQRRNGGLQ